MQKNDQSPEITSSLSAAEEQIANYTSLLSQEEEKRQKYISENARRRHNYLPFIMELLRALAKKGELMPLAEKARELTKARLESEKARKKLQESAK